MADANRQEGIPMRAPNDNTTPSRSGMRSLITPWASSHLRTVAGVRFAAGIFS
jgi:hypothetical protein